MRLNWNTKTISAKSLRMTFFHTLDATSHLYVVYGVLLNNKMSEGDMWSN